MNKEQITQAEAKFNEFKNHKIGSKDLEKASRKAGNLNEQMDNFKLLLSMIKDVWAGKFEMKSSDIAIIVGAIVYVVSPIDAIPDFIPFFGWVDDIAIVGYAMKKLTEVIAEYRVYKNIPYTKLLK